MAKVVKISKKIPKKRQIINFFEETMDRLENMILTDKYDNLAYGVILVCFLVIVIQVVRGLILSM